METAKIVKIKSKSPLTAMQERFCEYVLSDPNFNATEAAKRAGYKSPKQNGFLLMRHPEILIRVRRLINARKERFKLKSDEVLRELLFSIRRDVADYCDEDGLVKNIHEIPKEARKAIDGIKQRRIVRRDKEGGETVEVFTELKLTSKLQSVELAMKHLGLVEPDKQIHEHVHRVNWEDYYKVRQDDKDIIANRRNLIAAAESPGPEDEVVDVEYTLNELVNGELD